MVVGLQNWTGYCYQKTGNSLVGDNRGNYRGGEAAIDQTGYDCHKQVGRKWVKSWQNTKTDPNTKRVKRWKIGG